MPYGFNPNYYGGQQEGPATSFISGFGAGEKIGESALRRQVAQEALQRSTAKSEAMKRYSLSKDVSDLYPVMEPEQAATLPLKLEGAELQIAKGAMDVWDRSKYNLTLENYPEFVQGFTSKFPQINKSLFPPPEQFGGDPEKFNRWRSFADTMAAQVKSMPALIGAASREKVAGIGAASREKAAGIGAGARIEAATIGAEGKFGFPAFKQEYSRTHPNATFDEMWQQYKAGGAGSKAYSPDEQEKSLAQEVLKTIYSGPSKLNKEYEQADPAGKADILQREKERLRPAMFPSPKIPPKTGPSTRGSENVDPRKLTTEELKVMIQKLRSGGQ